MVLPAAGVAEARKRVAVVGEDGRGGRLLPGAQGSAGGPGGQGATAPEGGVGDRRRQGGGKLGDGTGRTEDRE